MIASRRFVTFLRITSVLSMAGSAGAAAGEPALDEPPAEHADPNAAVAVAPHPDGSAHVITPST